MDVDSYVSGRRHREYAPNLQGKTRGSGGSVNFDATLCERFTTGSKELDALFGGGVERGHVTEITADDYEHDHVLDLILTVCVTATVRSHRSLRRQGRSVSKIYFLDTQGYFRLGENQSPSPETWLCALRLRFSSHSETLLFTQR